MHVMQHSVQRGSMPRRRQSIETIASTGTTTTTDLMAVLRDIPQMELLPMRYANRKLNDSPDGSLQQQKNSMPNANSFDNIIAFKKKVMRKSTKASVSDHRPLSKSTYNPLKYVVYKKYNQSAEPKLQYISDVVVNTTKNAQKKKFFESDRRSKSKFDTIQFVFDNKDVDNKLYDFVEMDTKLDSGDRCNSWQFKKPQKSTTVQQLTPRIRDTKIAPMRQKFHHIKSAPAADATRIRQLFDSHSLMPASCLDETAGSLKKVKKLIDNFDNRCSCKDVNRVPHVQKPPLPTGTIHRKDTRRSAPAAASSDVRNIFDRSTAADPTNAIKKLDELTSNQWHSNANSFVWCHDRDRCKSPDTLFTDTLLTNDDTRKMCEKTQMDPCSILTAESFKNLQNLKDIHNLSELKDKFSKSGANFNNPVDNKNIHKDEFNVVSYVNRKLGNLKNAYPPNSYPLDDIQKASRKSISTSRSINESRHEEVSTDSSTDMGYFGSIVASDASDTSSTSSLSSLRRIKQLPVNSLPNGIADTLKSVHLSKSSSKSSLPRPINHPVSGNHRMRQLFPSRHGCDGAIFWNDCYYYEEEPCTPYVAKCEESSSCINSGSRVNYACDSAQVGLFLEIVVFGKCLREIFIQSIMFDNSFQNVKICLIV